MVLSVSVVVWTYWILSKTWVVEVVVEICVEEIFRNFPSRTRTRGARHIYIYEKDLFFIIK